MDEFNRVAWERARMVNGYHRPSPIIVREDSSRLTVRTIFGILVIVGIGWFAIWSAVSALVEHFTPAQPVPVMEDPRPDIAGQIRTLERMIAEANQLNADIREVHDSITKALAAQPR